jgi:hypothetical protein
MQQRVMVKVRERREGTAGGVKEPERGDVARPELDNVLRWLTMVTVQCVDFGLQHIEQAPQHGLQDRRRPERHDRRYEPRIQLEGARGLPAQPKQGHSHQAVARLACRHHPRPTPQDRDLRFRRTCEPVRRQFVTLREAHAF